ncbi:MAG TPA: flagellar hook-length control protein FliK [Pirellulaceae bacterium]|nr:flagellar hook-length control protein FliK [Pirellulaceae bacterium]HMO91553.1 flagellar hook-length control protein FliK [Pirellulaceae bacterium]HMP68250.1 flagellar hook-length control protein FliK [Pirellulaceae bacterium]
MSVFQVPLIKQSVGAEPNRDVVSALVPQASEVSRAGLGSGAMPVDTTNSRSRAPNAQTREGVPSFQSHLVDQAIDAVEEQFKQPVLWQVPPLVPVLIDEVALNLTGEATDTETLPPSSDETPVDPTTFGDNKQKFLTQHKFTSVDVEIPTYPDASRGSTVATSDVAKSGPPPSASDFADFPSRPWNASNNTVDEFHPPSDQQAKIPTDKPADVDTRDIKREANQTKGEEPDPLANEIKTTRSASSESALVEDAAEYVRPHSILESSKFQSARSGDLLTRSGAKFAADIAPPANASPPERSDEPYLRDNIQLSDPMAEFSILSEMDSREFKTDRTKGFAIVDVVSTDSPSASVAHKPLETTGINGNTNAAEFSGVHEMDAPSETRSTRSSNEPIAKESVLNQIIDSLVRDSKFATLISDRSMSLRLHPQELGHLQINVSSIDDNVRVQILATEAVTSDLLIREKAHLVSALREQGIDFPDVDISHRDPRDQDTSNFQDRELDLNPGHNSHRPLHPQVVSEYAKSVSAIQNGINIVA